MTNDPQTKDPTMTDEPNADLVEMLRAMRPDLEKISNERVLGLLVGWTMRVTPSEFLRILAWANARRDAAVEAKQTDSRDAQIVRLREALDRIIRSAQEV